MRHGQKGVYVIACGVSSRTHLLRLRNEYTWRGGETSTSISNAMLLKKNKTKSSTDKHSTAIIVHEAKRTATSTRTTPTRQNKPFEAAAVQQRRCPQLLSSHVPRVCSVIPSYIVSAHLVSYCLLVRQQQRFHHPTLRTSTDFLVGCIEQCVASSRLLYC